MTLYPRLLRAAYIDFEDDFDTSFSGEVPPKKSAMFK